MKLCEIENLLGFAFPPRHCQAMDDRNDPIHEACDFLIPQSPYDGLQLLHANEFLHRKDIGRCWPRFLIAFASNGCGDYFAYDTRTDPAKIIYIDPDKTVDENLATKDGLEFESFEDWYRFKVNRQRTNA